MTQLELFGPCIMGRKRKTEAEQLLDCERRAAALQLRVIHWAEKWKEDEVEVNLDLGPYGLICDVSNRYRWPVVGMDVGALEEELAWLEAQQCEPDDPNPDNRPRKALPRRAAA